VPTALVINGDFLDFAQAEPWQSSDLESSTADGIPLCFSEDQSVQKLKHIIRCHGAIFEGLYRITSRESRHRVIILPGNHDVDFFWPGVREEFVRVVAGGREGGTDKLHFHLEQSYRPTDFPGVWIEHGHQYDACNKFAVKGNACWSEQARPIFPDSEGVPRLLECVGTRFLIKYLNSLDAEYPFVDNVKPFSKFLKMFLSSTVHRDFGPIKALIAYWGFLRFFANTLGKSPIDILSSEQPSDKTLGQFRSRLSELRRRDAERLAVRLAELGFDFTGMPFDFYIGDDDRLQNLLDFLSLNPDCLSELAGEGSGLLSTGGEAGYLTLADGYLNDETATLKAAAANTIRQGLASAVVMGHTHEAVAANATLNYVNTGCWTRYLRDGVNRREWSWNLLQKTAYQSFPYELAYAEVVSERPGALVRRIFRP
jgi:hypothetical protein